ncbi:hypothetical protein BJV78DRAFT_1281257 [Lactifluus subvellereus]|nr:hypothetical protein BJV78DRAFT_1281257 [Lactifluus subvellereus]
MSYYPEHVYFQSQSTVTHTATSLRRCSVKGCGKDLPLDYALRMCEDCRGRHRKYATTKRAKRKQEKAAVGAQRIGNDDGRVVTWMPPDHHVSVGPIPEDSDPVPNMHASQIDPLLFNPTSSELAGALTLPPLDSSSTSHDPYISTSTQADGAATTSSAGRSAGQPRYCSVKGCRTVIGGDYLFKMCVPCRNRYRSYGMTKRSKCKRGREIAAQELERVRAEEDARRTQQGLPLIADLQPADRRAWERKVLETIPRPPVVQYAPISILPIRMCTVSHCHTVLQGTIRIVASTPLRSENAPDGGTAEGGSRKGKARAMEPLYTNEPLNLDARELENEQAVSEHDDMPDESTIPPPARGARRSNTVCSVKGCHNVLDYRSPWKMCETHREKDRMNRRRKSDRDKGISGDVDNGAAGQAGGQPTPAADVELDTEPDCPVLGASAPTPDPSIIFMEPLLPPAETLPTTMLQQSAMPDYSTIPPRDSSLLSYGSSLSEAGVLSEIPPDPAVSGEVDNENSSQRSIAAESPVKEPCSDGQGTSNSSQQDIQSMAWRSAVSPVSTGDSDSIPSSSPPISSVHSNAAASVNTPPSPATTIISTASVPAPFSGASTSPSHIQPQFQLPYYMPLPPFHIPYTPVQPPFLVPGPYPPMPYPPRPFACGTPTPGPFQAYQYGAPPPGQLGPFGLRPYPYPQWGPYASGTVEVNWPGFDAQMQTRTQAQAKSQRKRGRSGEDQAAASEDGPRIVMVQPKSPNDGGGTPSAACSVTSTSPTGPAGIASEPGTSPPSSSAANSPCVEASSTSGSATPAGSSSEKAATVSCLT